MVCELIITLEEGEEYAHTHTHWKTGISFSQYGNISWVLSELRQECMDTCHHTKTQQMFCFLGGLALENSVLLSLNL